MDMRRSKQRLDEERTLAVFERGTHGVLALEHAAQPYALPISYAYDKDAGEKGSFYFHCAPAGRKLDAIACNPRASLCVVDQDAAMPNELTTYFRSAIAFGFMELVEDGGEKRHGLRLLGAKYCPGLEPMVESAIEKQLHRTCVLALRVTELSGKEAIELVRQREAASEK